VELKVTIDDVSLADVVAVTYDAYEEAVQARTLGDEITERILDRMAADTARWKSLTDRFAVLVLQHLASLAPGYIEGLVAREVGRQLDSPDQGAVTRGEPSSKAQAFVATEVTTQLRAAFAPVVARHLTALEAQLQYEAGAAVAEFRRGRR